MEKKSGQCAEIHVVTEHKASIALSATTSVKTKRFIENDKLKLIRELLLLVLRVESNRDLEKTIHCVDLESESGICGLQWKKHFPENVNVVISAFHSIDDIKSNCASSGIRHSDVDLCLLRAPGDRKQLQGHDEVHVCQCSPNVLLQMEAFDFIFLHPEGHMTNHFDSVFCNLRNNGLLCLTSSDISSQFTRTANIIKRYFNAHVVKTDYMRELAVRVILSSIAGSAARCNKGIEVLLSACIEDNFLIIIRVVRGPKHADLSLKNIKPLLHCQMCEERTFLPTGLTPIENPYSYLKCDCHCTTPGRTAVILGPMWCDSIFSVNFLSVLLEHSKLHQISDKLRIILESLNEEAVCSDTDTPTVSCNKPKTPNSDNDTPRVSERKEENGEPEAKKLKTSHEQIYKSTPPFYFNLHKRKFKGVLLPRTNKLLTYLRCEGFRASRTHFDPNSVRTNASLTEFYNMLLKYCKKNS